MVPLKIQHFKSITEVPDWVWEQCCPNFHPRTDPMLACPETGAFNLHIPSMLTLQRMRDQLGPLSINSGHRSPLYNARKGGEPMSMHKIAIAFDIPIPRSIHYVDGVLAAREAGFTGIGIYPSRGFIHVDMGKARRWFGSTADKQIWEGWEN